MNDMAARQQDFQTGVNMGGKRLERLVIAVEAMDIDDEEPASCFRFGNRGNKRLCRGSARVRRGQRKILRRRVWRQKRGRCLRRGSGGGKPRRQRRGSRTRRHYRETLPKAKGGIVAAIPLRVGLQENAQSSSLCPAARSFSCHVDYMYTYPRPTWHPRLNQSDSEEGN